MEVVKKCETGEWDQLKHPAICLVVEVVEKSEMGEWDQLKIPWNPCSGGGQEKWNQIKIPYDPSGGGSCWEKWNVSDTG